mmetsp:Transcript_27263/g.50268  ORF Transcript_27263/g.50268 Transcript_27263/m.50268 type:complete len:142 (-) Transcript_27263:882-1307(-)
MIWVTLTIQRVVHLNLNLRCGGKGRIISGSERGEGGGSRIDDELRDWNDSHEGEAEIFEALLRHPDQKAQVVQVVCTGHQDKVDLSVRQMAVRQQSLSAFVTAARSYDRHHGKELAMASDPSMAFIPKGRDRSGEGGKRSW